MTKLIMCNSDVCPIRGDCYRYIAVPNDKYQPYFFESPYGKHYTGKCVQYIEAKTEVQFNQLQDMFPRDMKLPKGNEDVEE